MENNLDKLFKSKLEGQEPEFHPAAWDRMEKILDDEGLISSQEKRQRKIGFIYLPILLLGIIISIIGYIKLKPSELVSVGSTLTNSIELKDEPSDIYDNGNNKTIETLLVEPNKNIEQNNASSSILNQNNTTQNTRFNNKSAKLKIQDQSTSTFKNNHDKDSQKEKDGIGSGAIRDDAKPDVFIGENLVLTVPYMNKHQGSKNNNRNDSQFGDEDSDRIMLDSPLASKLGVEGSGFNDANSLEENILPIAGDNRVIEIELLNKTVLSELTGNKSEELHPSYVQILPHQKQVNSALFEMGINASSRFNNGFGYAFGPFVSFQLGNGYTIGIGSQFDVQKFESGPELSVFDKEYSFGSTVTERKFSMDRQKSIRIPITISKSFRQFEVSTGMIFNKALVSNGNIAVSSDGSISPNQNIDNQLIKSQYISLQLETAIQLNRYFKLGIGVEYKPQTFLKDQNTSNNQNTFYPTLGLEYIFFKF